MDKIPPRSDHPIQGGAANERPGKSIDGSDGRRGIRNQGVTNSLPPTPTSAASVKTSLKDRSVSKSTDAAAVKSNSVVKNLPETLKSLQDTIKKCSKPGYRKTKEQALRKSINTLDSISKKLADTGSDGRLKSVLNNLLNTKLADGRDSMTLSDFSKRSKLVRTVLDSETRTLMETRAAELLSKAHDALWLHAGAHRAENAAQTAGDVPMVSADGYFPKEFTAPHILENAKKADIIGKNGRFADDADVSTVKGWNVSYKRSSHVGPVVIGENGRPLNPTGATGISGRGALGLWGPNHAADTIVTRVGKQGNTEVLLIQRKDTGQWALPGGMVEDEADIFNVALKELAEEALAIGSGAGSKNLDSEAIKRKVKELKEILRPEKTYKGVVEDPRNTDNAWMETEAWSVHLSAEEAATLRLQAGDDAVAARWMPVTEENMDNLYASHAKIVRTSPAIKEALRRQSDPAPQITNGIVPSLDEADDAEVSVIPPPPPPPPLPGQDKEVVSRPSTQPEASAGYDAVIRELKQKLLEKGGPVEDNNPDVLTVTGEPGTKAPPLLAGKNRPSVQPEVRAGYDAVIRELEQKLFEKGGAVEESNPGVRTDPAQSETRAPSLPAGERVNQPKVQQSVKKGYDAVIEELKQKILARGGAIESDRSDSPQDSGTAMERAALSDNVPPVDTPTPDQSTGIAARKTNYDAVLDELKKVLEKRQNAQSGGSDKSDNGIE